MPIKDIELTFDKNVNEILLVNPIIKAYENTFFHSIFKLDIKNINIPIEISWLKAIKVKHKNFISNILLLRKTHKTLQI